MNFACSPARLLACSPASVRARWAASALIAGLVLSPATGGQVFGDLNGDGRVDAGELAQFAGCMHGPGAAATGQCAQFASASGAVDLLAFMQVQQAQLPPDACARGTGRNQRRYAAPTGLREVFAQIDTKPPVLCSLAAPNSPLRGSTASWIGLSAGPLDGDVNQRKWAQIGTVSVRMGRHVSGVVYDGYKVYVEVRHGPDPTQGIFFRVENTPVPNDHGVPPLYGLRLTSSNGLWRFYWENNQQFPYRVLEAGPFAGWAHLEPEYLTVTGAEHLFYGDRLAGSGASPFRFRNITYYASNGFPTPLGQLGEPVKTIKTLQFYQHEVVGADGEDIDFWDTRTP